MYGEQQKMEIEFENLIELGKEFLLIGTSLQVRKL